MSAKNHHNIVPDRLVEENRVVRKENAKLKTKCDKLKKENTELKKENEKLKKCVKSVVKIIQRLVPLLALLDENVAKMNVENALVNKILNVLDLGPQSQNAFKKKRKKKTDDKTSKNPGAQPGHEKTRERLTPNEVVEHMPEKCPNCGMKDLVVEKCEDHAITDLPLLVEVLTKLHRICTCRCNNCGLEGIEPETIRRAEDVKRKQEVFTLPQTPTAPQNHAKKETVYIPKSGTYSLNIIFLIICNYMDRLPHRLNVASMKRRGLAISVGTTHNILYKTGMALERPTADVLNRIRKAKLLHVDETGMSHNGKKVWLWVFFDPVSGETYYTLENSRGSKVLHKVLGKNWPGRIVCDGWSAYKGYRRQRCWSHIITRIRTIRDRNPDCEEAQKLLAALRLIHNTGKEVTGTIRERRRMRNRLDKRVKRLITKYENHPILKGFMTHLSNARPDLFVYVIDPKVPSTNNPAEKKLREPAVHRKVRGAIRSEDTMVWLGNLFTCIMTWRSTGADLRCELAKYV